MCNRLLSLLNPVEPVTDIISQIEGYRIIRGEVVHINRNRGFAEASVGVVEGQASILLETQGILAAMEASKKFTEGLEKGMSHHLKQIPYSNSLLSIKGIGEVTAAGLIGEVGDFRRYSTIGEIMKLAGLNLFEVSSGKYRGTRRISKRGRPLMRKLLYFAAMNMVRQGCVMEHQYQRYLDRGMLKTK